MKLVPRDRAEWLSLRHQYVTASVAGALLGVHPYTTYYELYLEKSGKLPWTDDDVNGAMLRGQLMESVAVEMIRRQRPEWKVVPNIIGEGGSFWCDPELHLGATPDALIADGEDRPGVVQIKSVDPITFRREWFPDGPHEPVPPAWIAAQVIVEAVLTNSEVAYVCPIRVAQKIDIDLIEVPIRHDVFGRIKVEVEEFWQRVADMRTPHPDYRRDGKLLAALLGPDDGSTVALGHDNEFVDAVSMREGLKAKIKEAEEDLAYYETLIRDRMGPAAMATTATHIITNKTQTRKAYTVPEKSFRSLRVKEIRP